jgi:hypothetical protein
MLLIVLRKYIQKLRKEIVKMERKELIKKLQGEKQYCFGMLEKEEQELIRELNKKITIQFYNDNSWSHTSSHWSLLDTNTFRIDPAYTEPEPEEFVYYDIFNDEGNNILRFHFNKTDWSICLLESFTNFITLQSYLKDKDIWFDVPIKAARDFYNNGEKLRAKFRK